MDVTLAFEEHGSQMLLSWPLSRGGAGRILSSATSAPDALGLRAEEQGLQRRRRSCPLLPGRRKAPGQRPWPAWRERGPVLTPGTALLSACRLPVLRLARFCPGRALAFLSFHGAASLRGSKSCCQQDGHDRQSHLLCCQHFLRARPVPGPRLGSGVTTGNQAVYWGEAKSTATTGS